MELIKIKPLSVNECWKGRRSKTEKYKWYEMELLLSLLPKMMFIPEGKLQIYLKFGFSNISADWDNPIKPFQDILQKKYGFDDKRIYRGIAEKEKVKKGDEYIQFEITRFEKKQQELF